MTTAMFSFRKSQTDSDLERAEARLNLQLTDFKLQDSLKIGTIIALIDRLPAFHLHQLQEITYDPRQLTLPQSEHLPEQHVATSAKGIYLQNKRLIAIFDTSDAAIFRHTLYHEIAHHVYFVVIGHQLKHAWVTRICRNDSFVSEYAATNAAEDFAESYVNYLLHPQNLESIPLKHHFMRDYVFRSKPATPPPEQLNILV